MSRFSLRKIPVKLLALFTVIRGYNVAMLVLAQYMASLFIFNQVKQSHLQILFDRNLTLIIVASALCASAGYIINNFYDLEKDAIGRPLQNYIERFISQTFKLNVYLAMNTLALVAAFFVSMKVVLFFVFYQFLVWFYCHKINKIVWLNNIYSVILMVFPFFGLFLYYENYSSIIFFHAGFLFLLLLITDILKDLTSKTADLIYNYNTLPVVYGERNTKIVLSILVLICSATAVYLWANSATGYMRYFFLFSAVLINLLLVPLWSSHSKTTYKMLHLVFKLLIGFGIFNMVFIDLNPLTLHNLI
jgi:4-hydroxybenzoate polyprenyltransferase